eukprot:TRINITY_DN4732_c0_g1_i4.p1 TRINITY_DN4732_c0_g1~~TRINITY_DN4732_c0_g1_i4.p1  ORF type:complete len:867 (-),score=231.26 TRINITY_DN4732_c0_g1_i4:147-2747(-)
MSMWGKFSNLTDQLSSAIAEDDVDGDDGLDPVSLELRRTRTQLERVSAVLATTKSELDRYKKESSDLAERLSASEVQTMHIGREYRNLLVEKEKELASVKAEHHHLKAEHTQLLMRNRLLVDSELAKTRDSIDARSNEEGALASSLVPPEIYAEDMTVASNIDSEVKIQRLTAILDEVRRDNESLRAAAAAVAQQVSPVGAQGGPEDMQAEVAMLRRRLQEETWGHQQEIATMQTMHQARTAELEAALHSLTEDLSTNGNNTVAPSSPSSTQANAASMNKNNKGHRGNVLGLQKSGIDESVFEDMKRRVSELEQEVSMATYEMADLRAQAAREKRNAEALRVHEAELTKEREEALAMLTGAMGTRTQNGKEAPSGDKDKDIPLIQRVSQLATLYTQLSSSPKPSTSAQHTPSSSSPSMPPTSPSLKPSPSPPVPHTNGSVPPSPKQHEFLELFQQQKQQARPPSSPGQQAGPDPTLEWKAKLKAAQEELAKIKAENTNLQQQLALAHAPKSSPSASTTPTSSPRASNKDIPSGFTPLAAPSPLPKLALPVSTTSPPATSSSSSSQDVVALQEELTRLRAAYDKASKNNERLMQHLVEKEDQLTQMDMDNSERISALEAKLATARQGTATHSALSAQHEALRQDLAAREEELERTSTALYNLQNVLEQFQAGQESTLQTGLATMERELAEAREREEVAQREASALRDVGAKLKTAEQMIQSLQSELTTKTRSYIALQEEVEPLQNSFHQTLIRLNDMAQQGQNAVDKRVVCTLVVSYFASRTAEKRREVLELMSRMLNFSEEQKIIVGLVSRPSGGWLPFFGKGQPAAADANGEQKPGEKSFADLWVDFLHNEAEDQSQSLDKGGGT